MQGAKSLDSGMRVATFAAADKSSEVREAGNSLVKRMVEVRLTVKALFDQGICSTPFQTERPQSI